MNKFKKYALMALATLGLGTVFTACQDDVDDPSTKEPVAALKPNKTILEIKEKYWDDATNYIAAIGGHYVDANGNEIDFSKGNADINKITFVPDNEPYVIKGTVVSSDEAGNVFKNLIIQDETAAITLSINSYNLYLKYRPGQEVVIDLKGMFIGKYNGLQQLGYPEWYANGSAWEATFMSPEFFTQHVELNGWPKTAEIDTIVVNSFSELSTTPAGLRQWQSQLVRFNNITFAEGGKAQFSTYHNTENQTIYDADGNSLIVRTSGYSNFWNNTLPEGRGDLVAICSYYGTTGWQLILNDYEGCMNFGNPTAVGTEDKPYSVTEAIDIEKTGRTTNGWVKGYIVGAVAPEVTAVTGNDDIEWGAPTVMNNTLVFAESADCKDWAQCMVVELANGSAFQTYGNLRNNPDNIGKELKVKGTLAKYMDTYGVTNNKGKASEFRIEGVEVPGDDEPELKDGNGTKEAPYIVSQVLAGAEGTGVWVTGYIVGTVTDKSWSTDCEFSATNASNTNFILGPTPDCTNKDLCIPIQLPAAVRDVLSVQQHPGNIGKQVSVCGTIAKYFGINGVKDMTEYELGEGGGGDTPTPQPPTGDGDGTEAKPFSVAQGIAFNPTSTKDPVQTGVWVEGYIVGWADMSEVFYINEQTARFTVPATMATNILIADTPTASAYSVCMGVQLPSGSVRSALNLVDNPGNLGKKVKVYGNIALYSGIAGVRETSKYVLDSAGGGDTPTPSNGLYSAPFLGVGQGDFIINNVTMPADLSYVWTYDDKYGMKASAYANNSRYATESWLISPVFDLSAAQNPSVTWDHAGNYFGTMSKEATVWVSVDGGNWQQLAGVQYPASNGWDFVSAGDISLAAYAGKKVSIGFKYTSTNSTAGTWEIKNFFINGSGKVTTSAAVIPGGEQPTPTPQPTPGDGDGTKDKPYQVAQVLGGAEGTGVWVTGYIVGTVTDKAWATDCEFSATNASNTNFILGPTADCKDQDLCIPVQLPAAVRDALSVQKNPGNIGKQVTLLGNLAKYFGVNGVKEVTEYVLGASTGGDTPTPEPPTGGDEPGEVVSGNTADFNTFNGGEPNVTAYGEYVTADGWKTEWSVIGCGGTFNNTDFSFISNDPKFLFPILNGRTDRQGKLTSPVLADGCGKVSFNWGFPYSDTKVAFTVYIYQDGKVVAKDQVSQTDLTKAKVYTYSHEFNVKGNFQIVIVNDQLSASTSNKDRIAIWDLKWTSNK